MKFLLAYVLLISILNMAYAETVEQTFQDIAQRTRDLEKYMRNSHCHQDIVIGPMFVELQNNTDFLTEFIKDDEDYLLPIAMNATVGIIAVLWLVVLGSFVFNLYLFYIVLQATKLRNENMSYM